MSNDTSPANNGSTTALGEPDTTVLLDAHTHVMERIASGGPLPSVLAAVAKALERLIPASRCSILLLDSEHGVLRHGAAPSIPEPYNRAIDGLAIGEGQGSCGTAAFTGRPVVAEDVQTDPHWPAFRHLAAAQGLRACWSSPISGRRGILGTFAVYHGVPYRPNARDEAIVGRVSHLAGIAIEHHEMTMQLAAKLEVEVAREVAEAATRAKSSFIASLSHELRTPLQAIVGFTESLQTLDLSTAQRSEALTRIDSATSHILSLVEDTLDITRIEAGALPVHLETVPLAGVVDDVVSLLTPLAAQRHATIESTVPAGQAVLADRVRLRQVLINIVGNAVRYGGNGVHITLSTGVSPSTARDGHRQPGVSLSVADDGPGISPEMMERLFVPFERLGQRGVTDGGAGLGMMLARNLVELMSGSLDVQSDVGQGTTVTITLPAG